MHEIEALLRQRPRSAEACTIERQQLFNDTPIFFLKDAASVRYMRLSEEGMFLWQLIDGNHTIRDLCIAYIKRFEGLGPDEALRGLARLTRAGFLTFEGADRDGHANGAVCSPACATTERSRGTWYCYLTEMDGRVTLLYHYLHWLYAPFAQAVLFIMASMGAIAFWWHDATNPILQANSLVSSSLAWIVSLALHVMFHEAAHAITCKHFGRSVHRAGIGWYYFAPVAFVDTSDMWPAAKLPRILVSAAGPYSNLVLAGTAALAALLPVPESIGEMLRNFSVMGYVLVLANINPLLELDGYYILMDLLEIPNLRSRALACLGSIMHGRGSTEGQARCVFIFFGACCLAYGIVVSLGVLLTYRTLIAHGAAVWLPQSYAQAIGWVLAGIMSLLIINVLVDGLRLGRRRQ
jgi:putative peptide zinc metalloprotease protein